MKTMMAAMHYRSFNQQIGVEV